MEFKSQDSADDKHITRHSRIAHLWGCPRSRSSAAHKAYATYRKPQTVCANVQPKCLAATSLGFEQHFFTFVWHLNWFLITSASWGFRIRLVFFDDFPRTAHESQPRPRRPSEAWEAPLGSHCRFVIIVSSSSKSIQKSSNFQSLQAGAWQKHPAWGDHERQEMSACRDAGEITGSQRRDKQLGTQ